MPRHPNQFEQKNSTFRACFTAVLKPIWTCRHLGESTTSQEMWRAFGVHFVAVAFLLLVGILLAVLASVLVSDASQAGQQFLEEVGEISHATGMGIVVFMVLYLLISFLFGEAGTLMVAVIFSPLAARVGEPWFESYKRTLKRIWLLTPLMLGPMLAFGFIVTAFGLWREIESGTGYVWRDILESFQAALLSMLVWWLMLWGIRSLAASHGRSVSRWPAVCCECGYRLVGLRADQACPECGTEVKRSVPGQTRVGTDWQNMSQVRGFRWVKGLVKLWVTNWLCPGDVGRSMLIYDHRDDHSRLLLWSLVGLGLLGVIGLMFSFLVGMLASGEGWADEIEVLIYMLLIGSWLGLWAAGITFAMLVVVSFLLGLFVRDPDGRPLFAVTYRAACEMLGLPICVWAVLWWGIATFVVLVVLGVIEAVLDFLQIDERYFFVFLLVGLLAMAGATAICYLVLVWRTATTAKRSNM